MCWEKGLLQTHLFYQKHLLHLYINIKQLQNKWTTIFPSSLQQWQLNAEAFCFVFPWNYQQFYTSGNYYLHQEHKQQQ
jgi:hypothetical protein